jgi:hypothetical protein
MELMPGALHGASGLVSGTGARVPIPAVADLAAAGAAARAA